MSAIAVTKFISLLFFFTLIIVMYSKFQKRQSSLIHARILTENPGTASSQSFAVNHYPIKPSILDLLFSKESGFIIFNNDNLAFFGYKERKFPVRICFPSDYQITWLGRHHVFRKLLWFSVNNGKTVHYFTTRNDPMQSNIPESTEPVIGKLETLIRAIDHRKQLV